MSALQDIPQIVLAEQELWASLMTAALDSVDQAPLHWVAILAAAFGFLVLRDLLKVAGLAGLLLSIGAALRAWSNFKSSIDG